MLKNPNELGAYLCVLDKIINDSIFMFTLIEIFKSNYHHRTTRSLSQLA